MGTCPPDEDKLADKSLGGQIELQSGAIPLRGAFGQGALHHEAVC